MNIELKNSPWLQRAALQKLLAALSHDGEEARIVGGAVRNALLGEKISDIDIATTTRPEETVKRAEACGFKVVPTGIEFGTVTVVADEPYEVTTLRADVETDGRHAKVLFGNDWQKDAMRRDFTINALYMDKDGRLYDDVGGLDDIKTRTLRFIGDAGQRIEEDYLRILRFFRFFAWYGAGRPDAEGLKASARLKEGLHHLSAERVWAELKKLLSAPDPSRALLWMRQSGVLSLVLPESEKWGIHAIHGVVATGAAFDWPYDPIFRLESLVPPDAARMQAMAKRLKLSNEEKERLEQWAALTPIKADCSEKALKKLIYQHGRQAVQDQLRLSLCLSRDKALNDDKALLESAALCGFLSLVENWQIPAFPVRGQDLIAKGYEKGKALGDLLKKLETQWIDSDFILTKQDLLATL